MDWPLSAGLQERLRAIGDDVVEVKADLRQIRGRVAILEANYASVSFRIDRVADRIERRLGLIEA